MISIKDIEDVYKLAGANPEATKIEYMRKRLNQGSLGVRSKHTMRSVVLKTSKPFIWKG